MPITILLADDHALVRDTLRYRLSSESDIEVVATAPDADRAVEAAIAHKPQVALLDIDMPGLIAFEAARIMAIRSPQTRVVFLSAFVHDNYIDQALEVRASGYLTKSEPPARVLEAIRAVAGGRTFFSQEVLSRVVVDADGARLPSRPRARLSDLTPRELDILRYIAQGHSQKETAELLHLSVSTVRTHSINLMRKLDIHDRVELARFAIREGLAKA